MAEIQLRVDRERLKLLELGTVIALEDGKLPLRAIRDVLATFAVAPDGTFLEREEALKVIDRCQLSDVSDIVGQFIELLKAAAVPPVSGAPSS